MKVTIGTPIGTGLPDLSPINPGEIRIGTPSVLPFWPHHPPGVWPYPVNPPRFPLVPPIPLPEPQDYDMSTERRIIQDSKTPDKPLVALSKILKSLSYSDMVKFSEMLEENIERHSASEVWTNAEGDEEPMYNYGPGEIAAALLDIADEFIEAKE